MQSIRYYRTGINLALTIVLLAALAAVSQSTLGATQTKNLAYIDTLTVINGGTFATTDPAFSGYNF
ncbi:MAG: hypothetical protein KGL13_07880, partial [Gammaproteobacteria bacterium]|nr:hypothetical protein [Gammaproteobacteria bacterium]